MRRNSPSGSTLIRPPSLSTLLPKADEIERWGTTSLILQRWSARDEEAALAWLDAHPDLLPADYAQKATSLTDEVRAQILRQSAPNAD